MMLLPRSEEGNKVVRYFTYVLIQFITYFFIGYYMYVEASRRRKGNDAKLELRSGLPTGKSCLSFFYNMHGGHKYMGTLRVLMNGETVFQKSGNQENTWHKAELTYRKGISSVRIQQEAKAYVYVA